jgi:hypothetical protein
MTKLTLSSIIFGITAAALLVGCEVSVGGKEISKATVEETTQKMLTAQIGEASPPITCPANLKAVVGTVMVCNATVDGKLADVTLTVTSVEGTDVKWNIKNSPHQ